jgi:4-carboxymuconolactone decarboxylase
MNRREDFLRRVAAGEERCVQGVLSPEPLQPDVLDRRTRALVQLSALLAVDAATTTLRWAAELASSRGADDATLAQVLLCAAPAAGAAQTVLSAPRLALALGLDLELEGWDGT